MPALPLQSTEKCNHIATHVARCLGSDRDLRKRLRTKNQFMTLLEIMLRRYGVWCWDDDRDAFRKHVAPVVHATATICQDELVDPTTPTYEHLESPWWTPNAEFTHYQNANVSKTRLCVDARILLFCIGKHTKKHYVMESFQ